MTIAKGDPIIIVGAGAFGLSTALHLSNAGYSNLSVFEKDSEIPPRFSAANDLNKIVRAEYEDPFYTDLTMKAIAAWQTPLFAPHFHQTGFLNCTSEEAPKEAVETRDRFKAAAEAHPELSKHVLTIKDADAIRSHFWQFGEGALPGWQGYLNRYDGYAHSGNALRGIYRACVAQGVRFFLGEKGAVSEVVYEHSGGVRKSTGVKTKAGVHHPAKLVIVAAGAAVSKLVPELGQQVVAKSWSVAHVHLTDDETSALRGIPVTYARDLGFFFEPDPETNLLKLCPMGGGYLNTDPRSGISHAPSTLEESSFVPSHDEIKIRKLLKQTLPNLANRPLVRKSLCWFADTRDSDFIIDYVPQTSSSVVALSGDSGHGFKMFPIFGRWVKSLLESPDGQQAEARWKWKSSSGSDDSAQWGSEVSWRLGASQELVDIKPAPGSKL